MNTGVIVAMLSCVVLTGRECQPVYSCSFSRSLLHAVITHTHTHTFRLCRTNSVTFSVIQFTCKLHFILHFYCNVLQY